MVGEGLVLTCILIATSQAVPFPFPSVNKFFFLLRLFGSAGLFVFLAPPPAFFAPSPAPGVGLSRLVLFPT